jgi:hypothetical protein
MRKRERSTRLDSFQSCPPLSPFQLSLALTRAPEDGLGATVHFEKAPSIKSLLINMIMIYESRPVE